MNENITRHYLVELGVYVPISRPTPL